MSATLLKQRPNLDAGGNGGAPARRAVVRWAWRLFRREWRQQILVLALLTIAVAATVLGAAISTNTPPPSTAGYGTADHLALVTAPSGQIGADIEALRQHFGSVDVIEEQQLTTGMAEGSVLRAQDVHGPFGTPMLALRSGRYPNGATEVAMTEGLAHTYGLHVGDAWTNAGQTRRLVGTVENPQNLLDDFALVAPDQVSHPDRAIVLFDADDDALIGYQPPTGVSIQEPTTSGLSPAFVVLAFAIFGLVFVGLVAVAGFSVLAQRRLRAVGMLSSLGAADRSLRLVMIANGALVGIVSAAVGGLLGLGVWIGYAPRFSQSVHHRVAWTQLPWWLVAAALGLAVATAVLAARRPARSLSRLSVVAALSGRPSAGHPVYRSAVPGAIVLPIGLIMIASSGGWGSQHPALQLGGLLVTVVGLLLLAPIGVTLLGRVAGRTPLATRLALRDLARYRTRSGAALAAVSFAVFTAVLIVLLSTGRFADPVDYAGPNLPANQLLLRPGGGPDLGPAGPGGGGPDSAPPQHPAANTAAVGTIAAALHTSDVLPLRDTGLRLGQGTRGDPGTIWLATPELLRHYGIDPATVAPDTVLLSSRHGLDTAPNLVLFTGRDQAPYQRPKVQVTAALPTGASQPNLLLTEYGARLLKVEPAPAVAGWLVRTPTSLNAGQINTARQLALAGQLTVETKSTAPSVDELRNVATIAGILIALGVLAMSVGLIRSEAARDLRTLAATGASYWVRRRISAATAGGLGLAGALSGTAVAYLAALAVFDHQIGQRLGNVPLLDLTLIVLGLPLAASLGSWLLAGRQPPVLARRAIE